MITILPKPEYRKSSLNQEGHVTDILFDKEYPGPHTIDVVVRTP
jgi:hypothetical protein